MGVNFGYGADEELSIFKQTSNTTLLNDVTLTSNRSWLDKASNSLFPVKSSFLQYAEGKLKNIQ